MARRAAATIRREADDDATRLVARSRVVLVTLFVLAAGLAFGEDEHPGLQYALAFGAVPASAALALAADRLRPRTSAIAGALVDAGVFAIAILAFPAHVGTLGPAFLVPVLVASYTGGRALGLGTGVLGLAAMGASDALGLIDLPLEMVLLLAIAVTACLAVVGRADARLLRSARYARTLETRATLLLDQLAEPLVGTDATGRVTLVNGAARDLLGEPEGATDCASFLGLRLAGAGSGGTLDCSNGCALLGVDGTFDAGGVEAVTSPSGRESRPVLVSVSVVPSTDGDTMEYVHTLRDITRLKLADEAKTLFLATATHELKTPLTVIRGFLETIDRPGTSEELRSTAMAIMRQRALELGDIIERILLTGRIESGKVQVEQTAVDAVAVARDRVAALAGATGRTLGLRNVDGTPRLLGDDAALATVLDHLLDNAGKYSDATDVIEVAIEHDERRVLLRVRDEGHGMTIEQTRHCFDRFWQGDQTSRRRVGGTGIGLYIVRSLVDSMGGTIDVESTPGVGSTFTVALPRADVARRATSAAAVTGEPVVDVAPEPSIVREFMRQIGVESKEAAT